MKPVFTSFAAVEVVNLNGKMIAVVGGTKRRQPFEIRLWGFDLTGRIVVLTRTWVDWLDDSVREIHRPCYADVLPKVQSVAFSAGLALGMSAKDSSVRKIDRLKSLFGF